VGDRREPVMGKDLGMGNREHRKMDYYGL